LSYITVTLNHFRALSEWAAAHRADARLDIQTFQVEVRRGEWRAVLHPRFLSTANGILSYSPVLAAGATAFIGWLPYRPIQWAMSTDKIEFKKFAHESGLRTPKIWTGDQMPDRDHVLKLPVGSFGLAVFGPYRAGAPAPAATDQGRRAGGERIFAEQFVAGRNVKAWFWGGEPFHLHLDPYPSVRGDGTSTVEALIARRIGRVDAALPEDGNRAWILSSLAYQERALTDVLPDGDGLWFDYRYGRRYGADPVQSHSDNMLSQLSADAQRQVREIGDKMSRALLKSFELPVLFAIDGVLDQDDRIWWLEANSNPILPPTGYPLVLATLFGQSHMPSARVRSTEAVTS
jgi:hypothetical protein